MKTYSTLIVTVGASIVGNIMRDEELKPLYMNGEIDTLASKMLDNSWGDPENARLYGSEINSTVSLIRNFTKIEDGTLVKANLFLFTSETPDGEKVGKLLTKFFSEHQELKFDKVTCVTIKGLRDDDEFAFGKEGLRNVVREFAKVVRNHRNSVAVNSTGGYKAQIAFALALGQAMKFPVYYRFERFNKIIKMPPLPVSLDWEIYLNHYDFLEKLEMEMLAEKELKNHFKFNNFAAIPEELKSFIEREKIDKEYYITLSAMGQVFLESAREMINIQTALASSDKNPEDKIRYANKESHALQFEAKHKIMQNLSKIPFIELVVETGYSQIFDKNELLLKTNEDKSIKVEYGAKGGRCYINVFTTAKNDRELIAAVEKIKQHFYR